VVIDNGTVQIEPLDQVLSLPLLWLMDFNLRRTAYGPAQTTDIAFLGHYGDRMTLAEGAASGAYQSPAHDWSVPAGPQELTVAAELNGGEASVTVETSDDGFATVTSGRTVSVLDGVNSCALQGVQGHAVRLRFDIRRPTATATAPVIDGFRVTAEVVQGEGRH
jgi:hypothetical protein